MDTNTDVATACQSQSKAARNRVERNNDSATGLFIFLGLYEVDIRTDDNRLGAQHAVFIVEFCACL